MDAASLNEKAQALLPPFKKELGDSAKNVSDDNLLKFLRWKPDVKRAADRFRAHLEWKQNNPGLFDESLRISQDAELERLLESDVIVAPPDAVTKVGGPVLIGRLRNNDMKDGRTVQDVCRMFFYTIDRILESPEAQLHGVTLIHDLSGFDRSKNAHIDIPKILFGGIIGHFPVRINAIYIWNAHWSFHAFFSMLSMLLFPKKLRDRCHFIKDLNELDGFLDRDVLLPGFGGKLQFDSKTWVQEQKERETKGSIVSMTNILQV